MAVTTIQLTPETRDRLKAVGRKGDTYDVVIRRLLLSTEYVEFMEDQYRILRGEKKWIELKDAK